MKIYVINLDRHEQRMAHMRGVLNGLDYERIAAVDGTTLEGEDTVCFAHGRNGYVPKYLSRFEKACIQSHLKALGTFLAGPDNYCCILEDDVLLSRDFPNFIRDAAWIPAGAEVIKIETFKQLIALGESPVVCFDFTLAPLLTTHMGTAGYIVSRKGAERIIAHAATADRAMDHLIFGTEAIQKNAGVYQLVPALCIQISRTGEPPAHPEMNSSIQADRRKPLSFKIKAEVTRPFHQLVNLAKSIFAFGEPSRPLQMVDFK